MKPILAVFSILLVATLCFAVTGHAQTATITYTYDDLNRLTNVSYQGGIAQTFSPDQAGNIATSTVTTASVDSRGVNATTWAFFGNTQSCGCGIPDAWAYTYGLNYYDTNLANGDPDYDGVTNLAEYEAGGNPDNGTDPQPVSKPVFDAVGDNSANVFVDSVLTNIILNAFDGSGKFIELHSDFTLTPAATPSDSFNPLVTVSVPAPQTAEFFAQTAGTLLTDPCFSFMSANVFGGTAHVPYLSALTTTYNQAVYRWRITLQMKPGTDIGINIQDCVLKDGGTPSIFGYADASGWYRQPWGQVVFVPSANPSITVYALPGPFATPGFTTPLIMDARSLPGLAPAALFNALYTAKAFFNEKLVSALPATGATNTSGQLVYDLHEGDMFDITVTIPFNNTVDIRYGADNVLLKYIGIMGTEYSTQ